MKMYFIPIILVISVWSLMFHGCTNATEHNEKLNKEEISSTETATEKENDENDNNFYLQFFNEDGETDVHYVITTEEIGNGLNSYIENNRDFQNSDSQNNGTTYSTWQLSSDINLDGIEGNTNIYVIADSSDCENLYAAAFISNSDLYDENKVQIYNNKEMFVNSVVSLQGQLVKIKEKDGYTYKLTILHSNHVLSMTKFENISETDYKKIEASLIEILFKISETSKSLEPSINTDGIIISDARLSTSNTYSNIGNY